MDKLRSTTNQQFPTTQIARIFDAKLVLFLSTRISKNAIRFRAFIVVLVFERCIAEHVTTQKSLCLTFRSKVRVNRSKCVVPLLVNRQVIQYEFIGLELHAVRNVVVHFQIQLKEIHRTHHQKRNIVFIVQLHLHFRLIVNKVWQKWQPQNREQPLQITLTGRKDIGRLFT